MFSSENRNASKINESKKRPELKYLTDSLKELMRTTCK